jgi:hypothetical protein
MEPLSALSICLAVGVSGAYAHLLWNARKRVVFGDQQKEESKRWTPKAAQHLDHSFKSLLQRAFSRPTPTQPPATFSSRGPLPAAG